VQDDWLVWMVRQVFELQSLKRSMEVQVVGVTEPASQQRQETMRWLLRLAVNMIA
jgi:hypothetical protein